MDHIDLYLCSPLLGEFREVVDNKLHVQRKIHLKTMGVSILLSCIPVLRLAWNNLWRFHDGNFLKLESIGVWFCHSTIESL